MSIGVLELSASSIHFYITYLATVCEVQCTSAFNVGIHSNCLEAHWSCRSAQCVSQRSGFADAPTVSTEQYWVMQAFADSSLNRLCFSLIPCDFNAFLSKVVNMKVFLQILYF